MNPNVSRWIFQSVAKHYKAVADGISLPYFVEGVDERDEDIMNADHVELRVTGPSVKELSNGYHRCTVVINAFFTKAMDIKSGNAFGLIQWTGVFAANMIEPIPLYKLGPDAQVDTGDQFGCLRVKRSKNSEVRIWHFGQLDKDVRIRQSEVDAEFEIDIVDSRL